jgi:hypothetical protein
MHDEAEGMGNAFVRYYPDMIHRGEKYMYRVLEPERATLCLSSEGMAFGHWWLEWLLREGLRPVRQETYSEIERWVISQQISV